MKGNDKGHSTENDTCLQNVCPQVLSSHLTVNTLSSLISFDISDHVMI